MFKFSVINFYGINHKFDVNIVRRFRVLNNVPKCWVQIASCTTAHGMYESVCGSYMDGELMCKAKARYNDLYRLLQGERQRVRRMAA